MSEFDAFLCYSKHDRDWVKMLLKGLEERKYRCCVDFRDFLVGAFIVDNIYKAINSSRKTIAVLSPDFVQSAYCNHELQTALSLQKQHQVIPILIRPCEVPPFLQDNITYLEWCQPDVSPYFWEHLVRSMERKTPNTVRDLEDANEKCRLVEDDGVQQIKTTNNVADFVDDINEACRKMVDAEADKNGIQDIHDFQNPCQKHKIEVKESEASDGNDVTTQPIKESESP